MKEAKAKTVKRPTEHFEDEILEQVEKLADKYGYDAEDAMMRGLLAMSICAIKTCGLTAALVVFTDAAKGVFTVENK